MRTFRSKIYTLCQNQLCFYSSISMQLCGFHSIIWYSICLLVIIPINFIYFNALPVAKKHQMVLDIDISSLYYHKQLVHETFIKHSVHFSHFLSTLSKLGIFALNGNGSCHSHSMQCMQCIITSQILSPVYNLSFQISGAESAVLICVNYCKM